MNFSFFKSNFVKNVSKLATGTILSQMLSLFLAPVLSRLYLPSQFANLALFLSFVTTFQVFSHFRYGVSIPLASDDDEVKSGLRLCFFLLIINIFIGFIFFLTSHQFLSIFFEIKNLNYWWFLIPISVFFNGLSEVLSFWFNRVNKYKYSSILVFSRVVLFVLLSLVLYKSELGLIYANFIASVIVGVLSYILFYKQNLINGTSRENILNYADRYKKFPIYNLPHALTDKLNVNGVVFLISSLYGEMTLGYYSFMNKIIRLPSVLIGNAVGQVIFQEINNNKRDNKKSFDFLLKITILLFFIGFLFSLILYLFAPEIFVFVFGEKWHSSGVYAKIMAPYVMIVFVSSPLAYVLISMEKQLFSFIINTIGNLIFFIVIYYEYYQSGNFLTALYYISFLASAYYIFYIISVFISLKKYEEK